MSPRPQPVTEPILSIESLRKSYGDVEVLKGIDVAIGPGDFLVLVGPSGCGKSTLLNCIAGLEETTSGAIRIAGRDVTNVPPKDRDIAMVFQSYALYPTMTVGENISFGMRIRGMKKAEYEPKVREVASVLRIDHLLDRSPAQLSGGQRQRVAMGRALVRDPKLFLFDEPLSNLDAKLRVEMRAEIKRLHERLQSVGTAIVYVTHDQIEALTLATKIVVLEAGIIQQVGTPDEIYARPANTFVADFMGSPAMNLIPATVARGAEGASLTFQNGGRIALDAGNAAKLKAGEVIVGVRPEMLRLGNAGTANAIPAKTGLVENAGSDAYIVFDVGGTEVTGRFAGRANLSTGETANLVLDPTTLTFFDATTKQRII